MIFVLPYKPAVAGREAEEDQDTGKTVAAAAELDAVEDVLESRGHVEVGRLEVAAYTRIAH